MNRIAVFASLAVIATSAANATAQTTSPYAGQQQRTIKALSDQEIGDLLEGRGMGLAKAGELNSYPGPLHVLQLAEQLELSDPQRAATNLLYSKMREQAISIGGEIIEAERTLDRAFADGRIEPATLRHQTERCLTLTLERAAVAEPARDVRDHILDDRVDGERQFLDRAQRQPAAARLVAGEPSLVY